MLLIMSVAVQAAASAPPPIPPPPVIVVPRSATTPPPAVPMLSTRPAQLLFDRPVKPEPRQPLNRLISRMDYPVQALRNGQQGTTGVVLTVDPEGRVDGCFVEQSSGSTELDATTCRVLASRARFEPARDVRDQRVASAVTTRVRWELPPMPVIPVAPWASTVTFEVMNGRVSRCTEEHSAVAPLFLNNCQLSGARMGAVAGARGAAPGVKAIVQSFARLSPSSEWIEGKPPSGTQLLHYVADLQIDEQGRLRECTFRVAVRPEWAAVTPDCRAVFQGRYSIARRTSDNAAMPAKALAELMFVRGQ